jgi:hypothetical protein
MSGPEVNCGHTYKMMIMAALDDACPLCMQIKLNQTANRIDALEAALREIAEMCEPSDCPDGEILTIDRIARFALGPKFYRAALAKDADK